MHRATMPPEAEGDRRTITRGSNDGGGTIRPPHGI